MPPLVAPAAFYAALGWSRAAFHRALAAGRLPPPTERTQGGHARWSLPVAAATVRAAGKAPPACWEGTPARSAA